MDEGLVAGEQARSKGRGRGPTRAESDRAPRRRGESEVQVDVPGLASHTASKQRADRLEGRIGDAATAFAAERYIDARRILKPIADEVPDVPEVRELYGLTLYRLGKWREAAGQLEAFVQLTRGSTEQHPVLADCNRALGRHTRVDELWVELRDASPAAEIVTEGRIVTAGSLADRGDLRAATTLLAKGFRFPRKPAEHHLRRAYALADMYERSGELPEARQIFGRLAAFDPDYLDVVGRIDGLG